MKEALDESKLANTLISNLCGTCRNKIPKML